MSLFSFGSGSGDIWSSAGFAFVSPINDILDKSSFTLEEILAQDEVLQEVKSLNAKLVDFLCKDSSIREMMAFIAEPPPEGASDNRVFKFPYMSCEIICCEVPHILNAVASENNHAALKKLFSMLDEGGDLDAHRAGYLEKVLTVLLRHRCGPTTEFLNTGGLDLFSKVVRHLGNFSVMQVAKLLLLPKYAALQDIDAAALMADGRGADGSDLPTTLSMWCNWSDDVEILHSLLREFRGTGAEASSNTSDVAAATNGAEADASAGGRGLVGTEGAGKAADGPEGAGSGGGADEDGAARGNYGERSDIHMHLSELLLALISQSSPESSFLKRMYSREMVEPLVSASTLSKEQGREARGSQAALQVLAALADRLVRPKPPITLSLVHGATDMQVDDSMDNLGGDHSPAGVGVGGNQTGNRENTSPGAVAGGETLGNQGNHRQFMGIGTELQNVDGEVLERGLRELVPSLCAYLRGHTEDPSMIRVQIKREQPRLGSLRLQVVRFIETLVRMDNPAIDQILMAEKAMATLLEMMFTYESSSMLHASVSSAVLNILGMSPPPPTPFGVPEATAIAAAEQAAEIARRAALSGRREGFQRHLFEDCRLVEHILEAVAVNEDAEKGPAVGGAHPGQPSTTSTTASPATGLSAIPEASAAPDAMAPSPPSPSGGVASGTESAEASITETQGLAASRGASVPTSSELAEHAAGVGPPPSTVAPTPAEAASGAPVTVASARPETGGMAPVDGQEEDMSGSGSTADASVHEMDAAKRRQRSRHGRRLGHMGHVLFLSKALMEAQNKDPRPGLVEEAETSQGPTAAADGMGAELAGVPGAGEEGADAVVEARQEGNGGEANGGVGGAATAVTVNRGRAARKSFVAGLLSRRDCAEQWQDYLSTTLAQELSRQLNPLGGFAVPSRDEENQLTTDFPDEAVDMDDTTGLLENIARMQNSPGMPGTGTGPSSGSGVSSNAVTAAGTQNSKMLMTDSLELDDDDDDFERMDSVAGASANANSTSGGGAGSSTGIGTLSDGNPTISMFTPSSFMTSGGAWSVAPTDVKSTAGVEGSAVCSVSGTADASLSDEGWANFADFGDPQQPTGSVAASGPSVPGGSSAGGSAGSSVGGFQSFDTVFSIETSPTTNAAGGGILTGTGGVHVTDPGPGPNAFAPSPPNWGASSGGTGRSSAPDVGAGGTVAEGTGGGNGSVGVGGGLSAFDSNSGGSGTGGFAEFSHYSFDPFSAMMEDTPTSLPLPPTGAQSSLQSSLTSGGGGGEGGRGGGGPGSSAPVARGTQGQGENADGMMDSTADPQAFPAGGSGAGASAGASAGSGAGAHADEDRMDDDTEEAEPKGGSGVSGEEGGASQCVTDENTSTATPRREPMEDSEAMVASDD